jgi:opacity protein-like surface antigen
MKSYLLRLINLFKLSLVTIFLFTFSKKSFAQTKTFFEGPYIGGAVGYTKFQTTFKDPKDDDWYAIDEQGRRIYPLRFEDSKITGTINAGYNWIVDKIYLLGLETEFSSGNDQQWESNRQGSKIKSDTKFVTNLRLKFGIIQNNNLYYASAGPAVADIKYNALWNNDEYPINISKTLYGISYGAGVERQVDSKGSIKFEYIITDLNSTSKPYPEYDGTGCWYGSCVGPSWKNKISSIRIGYNYHF